MHELSIVMSIVDIAQTQVRQAGAHRVESIELDIGQLAGVEWTALDFAWQAGVNQTVLEQAERIVNHIPGEARCLDCGKVFKMEALYDTCPECGSYFSDIIGGRELRVKALTVV